MGTVYLAGSHHRLFIHSDAARPDCGNRKELTVDILERPIMWNRTIDDRAPDHDVIRAALYGLMRLKGFDAAVSFGLIEVSGDLRLMRPGREWAEITLGAPDNVVARFSHDSRYKNYAFVHLMQWLEDEYPGKSVHHVEWDAFVAEWSQPERWVRFYKARILASANKQCDVGMQLIDKGNDLREKGLKALTALA